MILRSPTENENASFVLPAWSLSQQELFKVPGSRACPRPDRGFNVPSPNSKFETRNPEQQKIQVRKDASENIHVNLDSSTPCWNDA
jgi:hypothetical protein